ncbi:MAG: c-type cytochrome [Pseudohongiellaceae bacterium]|nr:c-type cytochrome [Pseudohongiellaceae bacterium]
MKHFALLLIVPSILAVLAAPTLAQDAQPTIKFCFTCHGTDGKGNESIKAPRLAHMESWYLKRQLELFKSGARGAHPQDVDGMEMQPMAEILSNDQIEEIVQWASTWEAEMATPTMNDGDISNGRRLYSSCASCHGDQAQGNVALNAPALQGQNDWYLVTQLENFKSGIRGSDPADQYGSQMRVMSAALSSTQDVLDVVAYINTLGR